MPILKAKDAGVVGLPSGIKSAGQRVDFKGDKFLLAIETKGYRLAWHRAAQCPCIGLNNQTDQPNPNCTLCDGDGWFLFKPTGAVSDSRIIGDLDTTQQAMVGSTGAVIRGIMAGITTKYKPYDNIIARLEGQLVVTVRPENKLGFYDRICNLDSVITYSELINTDGTATLITKYPVRDINLLRSETTVYAVNTDFTVSAGVVTWESGSIPDEDTKLVCHYLTHPCWRVIEHPHAARGTPVKFKNPSPETPQGDAVPLPVSAILKYEWLLQ